MSPQLRERRDGSVGPARYGAVQPVMIIWLTIVWIAIWGTVTPLMVVSGVIVAVLVCLVFPLPPLRFAARIRPWRVVVLFAVFAVDVVRASIQVSWVVVTRPPGRLRNAVVGVRLQSSSDFVLTGVAIMLSLVPGSVVVEARRSSHTLYLHVIDVDTDDDVEAFKREVLELEQRVLRAFEPKVVAPVASDRTHSPEAP